MVEPEGQAWGPREGRVGPPAEAAPAAGEFRAWPPPDGSCTDQKPERRAAASRAGGVQVGGAALGEGRDRGEHRFRFGSIQLHVGAALPNVYPRRTGETDAHCLPVLPRAPSLPRKARVCLGAEPSARTRVSGLLLALSSSLG